MQLNQTVLWNMAWYICVRVCVCASVSLEVIALGPVAALTSVWVQFTGVKRLAVISVSQFCNKYRKPLSSSLSQTLFGLFDIGVSWSA